MARLSEYRNCQRNEGIKEMKIDRRTQNGRILADTVRNTKLILYLLMVIAFITGGFMLQNTAKVQAQYKTLKDYKSGVVKIYDPLEIEIKKLRNQNNELKQIIKDKADTISSVVDYIHYKETSRGKAPHGVHVDCKEKGKSNEFGYGVMVAWENGVYNKDKVFCFDSFEDSKIYIATYIGKLLDKLSIKQVLCYYNTGVASESCDYSREYASR